MPLRKQPYLPLYVQDVLSDEKLIVCSASSQGVYFRLLCILHKQDTYGKFLLKQKYKQTDNQIENFALALARPLAFEVDVIIDAISELVDEGVMFIDGDFICQKRMIKDCELSDKRANAGSIGGKKSTENRGSFAQEFAQAKIQANAENEIEYEHISKNIDINNNIYTPKQIFKTPDTQLPDLKKEDTDTQPAGAIAKPKFDFRKALLSLGANKLHVDEWMTIRNKKKAVNSEYAFATFLKELEKSGQHIDEVLKLCSQKQWRGFEASWITELTNKNKKDDFRKMAAGIIAATNERERNREERDRIAKQQRIS